MNLLEKYEKYSGYYPLCNEGRKALYSSAEKICTNDRLVAEALEFKANLANFSCEPEFRQIENALKGKTVQFGAFVYTIAIEDMEYIYEQKAIPRKIFDDTIHDMSVWINRHYSWFGEWGLSEYNWLIGHLRGNLFKLSRLQFETANVSKAPPDELGLDLKEGDRFLDIHIPRGGRMDEAACLDSFEQAKEFFPKYLDYDFKAFGCETWLFDPAFERLLPADSNILKFQRLFKTYNSYENYDGLKYLFVNITKDNIKDAPLDTSFRQAIVKHILSGGIMQSGMGYRLV